jgi:hypothetical protein
MVHPGRDDGGRVEMGLGDADEVARLRAALGEVVRVAGESVGVGHDGDASHRVHLLASTSRRAVSGRRGRARGGMVTMQGYAINDASAEAWR